MIDTNCGIYAITGPNGRMYVGSTISFLKRRRAHFQDLRKGKHHSLALQRAFDKYGESAFEFVVLEIAQPGELLLREQAVMDANPGRKLYNSSRTAGNCLGVKHTTETRAKLSAQRKGRKHTAEAKAKVAAAKTGLTIPPEVRAKIGATQRARQTGKMKANNTSGFYGVTRHTKADGWSARTRQWQAPLSRIVCIARSREQCYRCVHVNSKRRS